VARTFEPIAPLLLLSLLSAATVGCGGGDTVVNLDAGSSVLDLPTTSISGQWSTTTSEVRDTCGFPAPPATSPLLVEDVGDSAIFSYTDSLGLCETSIRSHSGSVVHLSRSDVVEACGGMVLVRSEITYVFDGDGFTGTADHSYSNMTSACSNLPCEYGLHVGGIRCEGCWPGCVEPQSAPAPIGGSTLLDGVERW